MGQNKGNGWKEDGSNCQAVPCGHRGNHHIKLGKQVATVEVTIPMNKRYARAEVQDADMTAAMDKTVDILEGQVVRYKKRMHQNPETAQMPMRQNMRQFWCLRRTWMTSLW